jgi:hypothetical protein
VARSLLALRFVVAGIRPQPISATARLARAGYLTIGDEFLKRSSKGPIWNFWSDSSVDIALRRVRETREIFEDQGG